LTKAVVPSKNKDIRFTDPASSLKRVHGYCREREEDMKRLLVFSIVFFMIFGLSAVSMAENEYLVGLKIGMSDPTGDFDEDFDDGVVYGIFGEVAYSPYFSIEGSLVRHNHDASENGVNTLFPIHLQMAMFPDIEEKHFGGDKSLIMNELTLNGKAYLPGYPIVPYLTVGAGIYFWRFYIENLGDDTESDLGLNGGGGFLVPLGDRINLGVDVRYNHVFLQIAADEQSMTYWNILGTLAYGF
jgi:hypothetical protein